jgi:hypothetical protein
MTALLTLVMCDKWHEWLRQTRLNPGRPTSGKLFTLMPDSEPDQLLLRVLVSDEKGELEYVQKFYRAP